MMAIDCGDLVNERWLPSHELEAAGWKERLGRIESRNPDADDVQAVGSELFNALLGAASWSAMSELFRHETVIELRINLPSGDHELHKLHWEMMFSPTDGQHLAAMRQPMVAITRSAPSDAVLTPIRGLPRVLYVIGTSVDDPVVRPGLELMGMLRRSQADRSMTVSVLQAASLERLAARIASFRPDVVHIVSHGRPAELMLSAEENVNGSAEGLRGAGGADLARALVPEATGSYRPSVVVLSACDTATGLRHEPSLAAALVASGVPIVLGVGGKISDRGCRLFMRKFAETALDGSSLLEALALGRAAALRPTDGEIGDAYAARTLDWALPLVVLSAAITDELTVIDSSHADAVTKPITGFAMGRLATPPIFCGRLDFLEAFDELLAGNTATRALGAWATHRADGIGEKRLLDELTARTIHEGHIPCRLVDWHDDQPTTPLRLAAHFMLASIRTLDVYRGTFPSPTEHIFIQPFDLLQQLLGEPANPVGAPRFEMMERLESIASGLDQPATPTDESLRGLIANTFLALREHVMEIPGAYVSPDSRVVAFVSEVQDLDEAANALFKWMGSPAALGEVGFVVPVIFSCSLTAGIAENVNPLIETARGQPGRIRLIELGPFTGDEEFLAYRWALLHPLGTSEEAGVAYCAVRDPLAEDSWGPRFQKKLRGLPSNLTSDDISLLAFFYSDRHTDRYSFLAGDDDKALAEVAEGL